MKPRVVYLMRTPGRIECAIEIDEPTELLFKATMPNNFNGSWTSLEVQIDRFHGGQVINQSTKSYLDHVSMAVKIPMPGKFSVIAISDNFHAVAESITIQHQEWGVL